MHTLKTTLALLSLAAAPATAQSLVVPDNLLSVVAAFDPAGGAIHSPAFIDLDLGPLVVNRPIEVLKVGGELWISDDVLHRITRWSHLGGSQQGLIDPGFERLGGMALGFGSVWVTSHDVINGNFLLELDTSGNLLNAFPLPDVPEDVVVFGSELLVSVETDDLIRIDPGTGAFLGDFHNSNGSTGIDAPVQMQIRANGNVLAAGRLSPVGIYEYDPAGNEINYYDTSAIPSGGGVVGVHELVDGNILFSSTDGVYVYDVVALTHTMVLPAIRGFHISTVDAVMLGTNYCSPAVVNSSGESGKIAATGSDLVALNELRLGAYDLPTFKFGYFLVSATQGFVSGPGGSQGNLCLGGDIGRYKALVANTGNGSFLHIPVDLTAIPLGSGPVATVPGDTWNFTCWFRDLNPDSTSNFTDGISVTFN